jgi:plasmid stabilization system protein ParE
VPRVEFAVTALDDLDELTRTYSLPGDTRARVARSLRSLQRFPLMGPGLGGRWEGFRFLLGPGRWLVLVYVFIEADDRVVVVTVQDARSSAAAAGASRRRPIADAYGALRGEIELSDDFDESPAEKP